MNACLVVTALVLAWDVPPPPRNGYVPPPAPAPAPAAQQNRVVAPVMIQRNGIRGEGRAVQAKITIPRWLLPGDNGAGAAAPAPSAPAPPAAPAPAAPRIQLTPPPPQGARSNTPPLGSVLAGIAMSLAAVSLVFVFRGSPATKTACAIVVGASLATGAWSIAQADIAGQKRVRPPNAPPETEIVIELSDFGDAVSLQLVR